MANLKNFSKLQGIAVAPNCLIPGSEGIKAGKQWFRVQEPNKGSGLGV